jgi:hypothetical protein
MRVMLSEYIAPSVHRAIDDESPSQISTLSW